MALLGQQYFALPLLVFMAVMMLVVVMLELVMFVNLIVFVLFIRQVKLFAAW